MEIGNRQSAIGNLGLNPTAIPIPDSRLPIPDSRLDTAARDFEAVFIAQMLVPLFSSIETPAIAGGGKSDEFFNSLLQEHYAKAMADRGGFGIADHVRASLLNLQSARTEINR